MRTAFKYLIIGFGISFVGSIPLGYLNLVGLQWYREDDILPLTQYLLGVVVVEILVIYVALTFASKLILKTTWKRAISWFSLLFLLGLAFTFYQNKTSEENTVILPTVVYTTAPFLVGLTLSSLNFAQIPFWFSWNLYLINNRYIQKQSSKILFFLVGAGFGTFSGMFTLILGLKQTLQYAKKNINFENYIGHVFLLLAIIQGVMIVRDYRKEKRKISYTY